MALSAGTPSGFYSQVVPRGPLVKRDDYLVHLCQARRVVHIGCSDSPITARRLDDGSLLHARLMEVTTNIVGVDIDAEATELIRTKLGGDYEIADISDPAQCARLGDLQAEVLIASDVLEHVPDASAFLGGIRRLAESAASSGEHCQIVISTPNGLALRGPLSAFLAGIEPNHPDHRALYTPSTLTQALVTAGLRPVQWAYYTAPGKYRGSRWLMDKALRAMAVLRPSVADGMVVVAEPARG